MVDGTPEGAALHWHLDAARAALEQGHRGRALAALLEAWGPARGPRLTALVIRLGEEAARGLPPIEGATRNAFHEQWLDVAAQAWPADLPRLLDGLRHPPWTRFGERLQRLERFPPDPRLGLALARFVHEVPVRSSLGNGWWRQLFRLLDRSAHQGCARWLQPRKPGALGQAVVERTLIDPARATSLAELPAAADPAGAGERLAALEAAVEVLAAGPPATPELLAHPGPGRGPDEAGLLAAVYAAPADDAPRLVYGDWLLERGDPRGTFIQWQYRSAAGGASQAHHKREAQLLKRHLAAWLGPLEPVVVPGTARFERGFLSEAATRFASRRQRSELLPHPAWATLRAHVGWSPLLQEGDLPSLTAVRGPLTSEEAAALAERPRPLAGLRRLVLAAVPGDEPALARLAGGAGLPALEELELAFPSAVSLRGLPGTPLGARVRRLRLLSLDPDLSPWWGLCRELPALDELRIDGGPRSGTFRRGDGAWALELSGRWTPSEAEQLRTRLGGGLRVALGAQLPPDAPPGPGVLASLARDLLGWGRRRR